MKTALCAFGAAILAAGSANAAQVVHQLNVQDTFGLRSSPSPRTLSQTIPAFERNLGSLSSVRVDVTHSIEGVYQLDPNVSNSFLAILSYDWLEVWIDPAKTISAAIMGSWNPPVYKAGVDPLSGNFSYTERQNLSYDYATLDRDFMDELADGSVIELHIEPTYESGSNPGEDFTYTDTWNIRVTYDYAAAIPEPSIWLILILGFAAIGTAMRQHLRRPINLPA